MNWNEFKKFSTSTQAIKRANEDIKSKIVRTAELLDKYQNAKVASENARKSTPCIRAMRQYMRAVKNASDPRTPFERVKELLDAKIAADPINKVQSILRTRLERKQAAEAKVTVKPAKTVEFTTALKNQPEPEKALEGNEEPDTEKKVEGRTVTFSDGRTVDFPAKDTTPVKSASEVNPMVASIKAALAKRREAKNA